MTRYDAASVLDMIVEKYRKSVMLSLTLQFVIPGLKSICLVSVRHIKQQVVLFR